MGEKVAIGQRIKELREFLGLSQKEFADALGIHPMSVSRYELGRSNPSPSVLRLIEDKFGVNPEWLLEGKGDPFKHDRGSDNLNFKFGKRWREVKNHLEDASELIVDICLSLFLTQRQKKSLNLEALKTYLKNRVNGHLLKEADRSLHEVLELLSCLEKAPPFDKFKVK